MRFVRVKKILEFVLTIGLLSTCARDQAIPEVEIHASPQTLPSKADTTDDLTRLEHLVGKDQIRRSAVSDIFDILTAENHEERGDWAEAKQHWLYAVNKSTGPFAEIVFKRWVRACAKVVDPKGDPQKFLAVILAETENGQKSEYMKKQGLLDSERLMSWLRDYKLMETDLTSIYTTQISIDAPTQSGIPVGDPLFERTSKNFCMISESQKPNWNKWINSLSPALKRLWQARVAECSNDLVNALKLYNSATLKLSRSPKTATLGAFAAERVVDLYKQLGMREEMANGYIQLLRAFSRPGVNHLDYGEDQATFVLRHANASLYAARYRAMVADYLNAKSFVQEGLDLVNRVSHLKGALITKAIKKQMMELRADAHHILAFRIALEQGDLAAAKSLSQSALGIPDLSPEWRLRFQWNRALYEFKDGKYQAAIDFWEDLVKGKDREIREKTLFWLARAYEKLDNPSRVKSNLEALIHEFPLGFYAVKGIPLSGFKDENLVWNRLFSKTESMEKTITSGKDYDLSALRSDSSVGRLLLRSEILVAANIKRWAEVSARELGKVMRKTFPLQKNLKPYIYVSRLMYEGGDYFGAMGLTAEMAEILPGFWRDFPEQVLIYFPRPYDDVYSRFARDYFLEKDVLYGVSRQESGFRKDIKSPADAYGLMQLIVPTAEKTLGAEGVKLTNLKEKLLDPETNVRAGAAYLHQLVKHYRDNYAAVYAAYNAGDYAVDIWQTRRVQDDPLLWIEFIPFLETKTYVKYVWRNQEAYKFINANGDHLANRLKAFGLPVALESSAGL